MSIYIYMIFITIVLLLMYNITRIKWNMDYFKEIEKQCI